MTTTAPFDREIRRILEMAENARSGVRREGDKERPLGSKALRTRQTLLLAAYDQFARRGYRATTVQDIHEAAGVSLGTFYQYFREKADVIATLVGELIIDSADSFFRPFIQGDDGGFSPEVSAHAVEPFVRNYAETADFQRVWEEVTHIEAEVAAIRWEVTDFIDAGLRDEIAAGQAAGFFEPSLDAANTAKALNSMVDRYCYRTFVVEDRRDPASVDAAVDVLMALWRSVLTPG